MAAPSVPSRSRVINPLRRSAAWLAALALTVGGVTVAQQWQSAQEAAALYPPNAGTGGHILASPVLWDSDTVYVATSGSDGIWAFTTGSDGLITSQVMNRKTAISGSSRGGETLAVDGGSYSNAPVGYIWAWDDYDGTVTGGSKPSGSDWITIEAFTTTETRSHAFWIPTPSRASGVPLSTDYWSGGEVIQKTGEIFFSGGECAHISSNYRMMIIDPSTADYRTTTNYRASGVLQPANPSDNFWGSTTALVCNGNGTVASDLALDGYGNAYIMVQGTAPVGNQWRPTDLTGNNARRIYLVRVTPGPHNSGWKYNVVQMLSAAPGASSDVTTFTGSSAGNDNSSLGNVYGMAFLNGQLYFNRSSDLFRVDPMSGLVNHVPQNNNDNMSFTPFDLASGQTAYVVAGAVFNDANANGARDEGELGLASQTLALYNRAPSGAWSLAGVRQTDGSGDYSFITSGEGDYIVRLVRPKVDGVNAIQTYASSGLLLPQPLTQNRVEAQCYDSASGSSQPLTVSGPCAGNLTPPFSEAWNSTLGSSLDPALTPIYSSVHLESPDEIPAVDFGVTAAGSYGDSAKGPATVAAAAPGHLNGVGPSLYLGASAGVYAGPATDGAAHNATDDGLYLQTYGSARLPFNNGVYVAGRTYTSLRAQVSGDLAADPRTAVKAWLAEQSNPWSAAAAWAPSVSAGVAAGDLVLGTTVGQSSLRLQVSTSPISAPTNSDGQYMTIAPDGSQPWASNGEIEDYVYRLAAAVYRPAATATGGSGSFQIDGQTLAAAGADPVFGVGQGIDTAVPKVVPIVLPSADWRVSSAQLFDTETGQLISTLPYQASTATTGSVTMSGVDGRDLTLQVNFAKAPDPDRSQLELDRSTTQVGTDITATVTVRAADGTALAGIEVGFAVASADLVLHDSAGQPASDCVTDGQGQCSILLTSDVADVYSDGLSATIVPVSSPVDVSGSPATVTFEAGSGEPGHSELVVTPAGPLVVGTATANRYTATATVRDGSDNLVTGAQVSFSVDPADTGLGGLSATSCTTVAGVCQVYLTSTKPGDFNLSAKIPDPTAGDVPTDLQGSPAVRSFEVGPVSPGTSSFNIAPAYNLVGEAASGSVTLHDNFGNPVLGLSQTAMAIDSGCASVSDYSEIGDGTYNFVLTAAGPADCAVTVTVSPGGTTLQATAQWAGVVPTPDFSSLTLTPTTQFVGDNVVATVTVRDQHDRPITGLTASDVVLSSSTGSPDVVFSNFRALTGPGQAGQYAWDLTSQKAGSKTITADVSGVTLTGAGVKTVTFQSIGPDDAHTSFAVLPHAQTPGNPVTATLVVHDRYDNPVIGLTAADITLDPDGLTVLSGPVEQSPGQYVYSLSTAQAAQYDVLVTVGSVVKSDSVVYSYDAVDPDRSVVQALPATQTVGQNVAVTVTVKDAHDNLIPDLVASDFAIVGRHQTVGVPDVNGVNFFNNHDGTYSFTMTSRLVGQFLVQATVQGVLITQQPPVSFSHGGVCVTNCETIQAGNVTRAEMITNDRLADGSSQDMARIWAFDTYGNAVDGAQVIALAASSPDLRPQTNQGTTGLDGSVELLWTSFQQGIYTAEVTIDGLRPDTGILNQIRFTQTQPRADRSDLQITPAGPLKVGQPYTARVVVRDAQDTPLSDITVSFSTGLVSSTEPNPSAQLSDDTCLTGADGSCSVQVTSRVAGEYDVYATVPVLGQATHVRNSPTPVTFEADTVCVTGCDPPTPDRLTRVEVTLNSQTPDGVEADEATVWTYDRFGNVVTGVAVATSSGDTELIVLTPTATTGSDGRAVLRYASLHMGLHPATVEVADQAVIGSPIELLFSTENGDPSQSYLTVDPPGPLVVDSVYTVTAHVLDAVGVNPINNIQVNFTVQTGASFVGGVSSCVTAGTGAQAGTCSVQVTSQTLGTYEVGAKMPNALGVQTDLGNSPVEVEFEAGPVCVSGCDPPNPVYSTRVEVIRNGSLPDGADQDRVRVWAYDRFGNPVKEAAVSSSSTDTALAIQPAIDATGLDGSTTIWYTSTVAGNHTADVLVAGLTPPGSPVTLGFGSGQGDPDHSSFTITPAGPLTVGLDAASTYTITAQVHDVFDEPVTGDVVTFAVDPAGPLFGAGEFSCITTATGSCQVTLYSTASGTYSISGELARGPIGQAQSRAWRADDVCSEADGCVPPVTVPAEKRTRIEVTVNDRLADGSTQDLAVVHAFDQWGNAVPGGLVTAATDDAELRILPGIPGTSDQGTSTIRFTSETAGDYEASAWVDGHLVTGSPVGLTFVPGPPCLAPDCVPEVWVPNDRRSRIVVGPDHSLADGVAQDVAQVFLFDRTGNPVPGVTVTQSTTDADLVVQSAPIAATGADGRTTIRYTSEAVGPHQARAFARVNGVPVEILFTPQPVPPAPGPAPVTYQSSPFTATFDPGLPCVAPECEPEVWVPNDQRTRIVVDPDDRTADGSERDTATVYLFDQRGNPTPGYQVTWSSTDSDLVLQSPASGVSNAAGQVPIWASSRVSGEHTAQAFVTVGGRSVEIVFTPQPEPPAPGPAPDSYQSSPFVYTFVAGP
ncbi:MAG: Ig-like domain-containing protein, partial [Propionibacteriaceae bacterium]|nr:Ig-like domain-containing protein [Propionibacteriaceae bacterium]